MEFQCSVWTGRWALQLVLFEVESYTRMETDLQLYYMDLVQTYIYMQAAILKMDKQKFQRPSIHTFKCVLEGHTLLILPGTCKASVF